MQDERERRWIDAVAARALLLDPGECFAVRADGAADYAEECVTEIEESMERQYAASVDLLPWLAHPDTIGTLVITTSPEHSDIIFEHVAEDADAEEHLSQR